MTTNKTTNESTTESTNKFADLSKALNDAAKVKAETRALGETFVHNGRSVQVVELQAEGVYHVKATDAPFDTYWINTGEAVDINNELI